MDKSRVTVAAIIPVYHPGEEFRELLKRLSHQSHGLNKFILMNTGDAPWKEEVEREFDGQGYGVFKPAVGEAVVDVLRPLQERVKELEKDKAYIDSVIKNNGEKAQYFSTKTLRKVQKKIGFPERIR